MSASPTRVRADASRALLCAWPGKGVMEATSVPEKLSVTPLSGDLAAPPHPSAPQRSPGAHSLLWLPFVPLQTLFCFQTVGAPPAPPCLRISHSGSANRRIYYLFIPPFI